jgi:alpha/beta superfamily hydrolase
MKRFRLLLLFSFVINSANAQDITGQWSGILKEVQLTLVFNITKTDNGFVTTMDSPDQGAKDIPVAATIFENGNLKLTIPTAQIEYTGIFKDEAITGTFKQNGQLFSLNLSKGKVIKNIRSQEPVKPYPYYTEEVSFKNKDKSLIKGTLSLPSKEGRFPAVILITGSGPQNRDEEIMGHKPFLVIADFLTKNGIAVLRYDDRGVGESEGDFSKATTLEFAEDAKNAVMYLKTRKEIDLQKIGLIGHSEGGIAASMVAANTKDVSFIVLLASTGIKGAKVLLQQQELMANAAGISKEEIEKSKEINSKIFELIINSKDDKKLKLDLEKELRDSVGKLSTDIKDKEIQNNNISIQVNQLTTPWMKYFLSFDPSTVLEKVNCRVLALNGEKDLQVAPKENLSAIQNALNKGGNKATVILFPNLNHLFQDSNTGLPIEYGEISETFSPDVLQEITKWIKI